VALPNIIADGGHGQTLRRVGTTVLTERVWQPSDTDHMRTYTHAWGSKMPLWPFAVLLWLVVQVDGRMLLGSAHNPHIGYTGKDAAKTTFGKAYR
jgi:hypothetical protein